MINILRAGHATFTTPDVEKQVAYYTDVLGLIVSENQGSCVSCDAHGP